ncbi:hypothetical protein BH23PAT2_BH23PAT2_08930 [soil metagenome]
MDEQKQQFITRLKESTNVLVTVSKDPSIDQLAAAIGLTLALNKLKKHATAVFSGKVPPVMEFLKPEETIRKNTNSLRDFIISLDRDKADKLRYKVEDKVVRIFISPYHSAITEKDLNFDQGDFNVDVVIALGVHEQADLDETITAHGRILHDATVVTLNTHNDGTVGSIHLLDNNASGLSEMLVPIIQSLNKETLDSQIATALLTGIVAETDRFSNDKTKSSTMAVSSQLMAAGANQQLVSAELESPPPPPPPPEEPQTPEEQQPPPPEKKSDDGILHIDHSEFEEEEPQHQIDIDDHGNLYTDGLHKQPGEPVRPFRPGNSDTQELPKIITKSQNAMFKEEPKFQQDDTLLTDSTNEGSEDMVDLLSDASHGNDKILSHNRSMKEESADSDDLQTKQSPPPQSPPAQEQKPDQDKSDTSEDSQTLADIEQVVGAHQTPSSMEPSSAEPTSTPQHAPPPELDEARKAIMNAVDSAPQNPDQPLPPIKALNAQPVDLELHPAENDNNQQNAPQVTDPNAPPAVPPPMMPPIENSTSAPSGPQLPPVNY